MHVDTANTHVVSAIINVDQEVEQDWLLVILDHEDNEHSIIMRPGDLLLYESAKLLHGRPSQYLFMLFVLFTDIILVLGTFVGKHYDNIFVHYQPVAGWEYGWI
jgi:hypothetical protein